MESPTFLISVTILVIWGVWSTVIRMKRDDEHLRSHMEALRDERVKQVIAFRSRMKYEFDDEVHYAMPSFRDMVRSDKALTAKNWVNCDKLVCLN